MKGCLMTKSVWIINQYASTPETGLGGRHYYLAKELSKLGLEVTIISSSSHHLLRNKPKLTGKLEIERVEGFNFAWVKTPAYANAHSKQRILNWFLFSWRLRQLSNKIKKGPDVILVSSPSLVSFLGAYWLSKKHSARLIFEVRDIWPLSLIEIGGYSQNHPFIKVLQFIEDKAYKYSDAVVSNLKNSVDHMVKRGMDSTKFTWIPNGYSKDEVELGVPLNQFSLDQLPKNKFIVGYAGTIGVANSLDTLISSAVKLKEIQEIAFVIVGSGREKEALIQNVKSHSLDNVYFIDPIPKIEIQSMLARFDVCYIGLTKDPLFRFGVSPNKLFDYLYSAKPIIYAIESGGYMPVSEANAGLQILAQNVDELEKAIIKVYEMTESERNILGVSGRKYAEQYHEYHSLALAMNKVLESNG